MLLELAILFQQAVRMFLSKKNNRFTQLRYQLYIVMRCSLCVPCFLFCSFSLRNLYTPGNGWIIFSRMNTIKYLATFFPSLT